MLTGVSTHATPLTYEQRCERYWRQTGRRLTPKQHKRVGKKIDHAFYRQP